MAVRRLALRVPIKRQGVPRLLALLSCRRESARNPQGAARAPVSYGLTELARREP